MNLKYKAKITFYDFLSFLNFLSMKLVCEIKRARQKYGEGELDFINILNNKLDF